MSNLINKLIGLGDPQLTADFQTLCGIRKHKDFDSRIHEVTDESLENSDCVSDSAGSLSNNKASGLSNGNGHIPSNGHATETISNGCVANGHIKQDSNGINVNGLRERKNGLNHGDHDIDHRTLSNGQANGFTNINGLKNGLSNGLNGVKSNGVAHGSSNGSIQTCSDFPTTTMQSDDCSSKYTIENDFLYYIFSFGASLGNEVFYIMFFTFTIWSFDVFVVRKMLIVWCPIMYLGQAAKDVIRWPRPHSPPVVRMEERYELEYGMPSTHAMVGVAIPFGMLVFMCGRYEFNFVLGLLFATTWGVLVSLSRLYLGMHSVLDIVAGTCFAFLIMWATLPFVDSIDKFLMGHPYALPIMVSVCIALCLCYPTQDKWNSARGDTTLVLSVFSGIYAGLWLTAALTMFEPVKDAPSYVLGLPSIKEIGFACLRQVIGVFFVVLFITVLKIIVLRSLSFLLGFDHKDPETKKRLIIELPYRYVSYTLASTAACYLMPLLFLHLNIERPSFYSEIFNY